MLKELNTIIACPLYGYKYYYYIHFPSPTYQKTHIPNWFPNKEFIKETLNLMGIDQRK